MSDDSKEREYAAVRALDLVRPAGSIDSPDYLAALDEAEKICTAQRQLGADNRAELERITCKVAAAQAYKEAMRSLLQMIANQAAINQQANTGTQYGMGQQAAHQASQAQRAPFGQQQAAQNMIASDFITYSSQGPGEIYCLRDLPEGTTHPTISLINEMNAALNEYAKARGFGLQFRERCGTQYKITTDVLQYYIVRSYGM